MTDIEARALELLNDVRAEGGSTHEALCRAIEQHEAFRQEVSEAVKAYRTEFERGNLSMTDCYNRRLSRFIIQPKTDPLVEVLRSALPRGLVIDDEAMILAIAKDQAAAVRERGLEIREVGE